MEKSLINTIYIMSKGRPECVTAQMLTSIRYPGSWFIVCGDNDDTVPQYKEKWGADKVFVFNWKEYVDKTDLLDPFGVEGGKPSGAAPARNAIRDISKERGEKRHWQLDDDISIFYDIDPQTDKKIRIKDGDVLCRRMAKIAQLADDASILDMGISGATLFVKAQDRKKYDRQVFVCHNLRSDDGFLPWRGRMADDLVQAIDTTHRPGMFQFSIKWFGYAYAVSAKNPGGNTDLYLTEGYIRKAGYSILVGPSCAKMRFDKKDKPHIIMSYPQPKILHNKWRKS